MLRFYEKDCGGQSPKKCTVEKKCCNDDDCLHFLRCFNEATNDCTPNLPVTGTCLYDDGAGGGTNEAPPSATPSPLASPTQQCTDVVGSHACQLKGTVTVPGGDNITHEEKYYAWLPRNANGNGDITGEEPFCNSTEADELSPSILLFADYCFVHKITSFWHDFPDSHVLGFIFVPWWQCVRSATPTTFKMPER